MRAEAGGLRVALPDAVEELAEHLFGDLLDRLQPISAGLSVGPGAPRRIMHHMEHDERGVLPLGLGRGPEQRGFGIVREVDRAEYRRLSGHGRSAPRIMKKIIAESSAVAGTVITQAAAMRSSSVRLTSSTRWILRRPLRSIRKERSVRAARLEFAQHLAFLLDVRRLEPLQKRVDQLAVVLPMVFADVLDHPRIARF